LRFARGRAEKSARRSAIERLLSNVGQIIGKREFSCIDSNATPGGVSDRMRSDRLHRRDILP
jgi:hypothetical protein